MPFKIVLEQTPRSVDGQLVPFVQLGIIPVVYWICNIKQLPRPTKLKSLIVETTIVVDHVSETFFGK